MEFYICSVHRGKKKNRMSSPTKKKNEEHFCPFFDKLDKMLLFSFFPSLSHVGLYALQRAKKHKHRLVEQAHAHVVVLLLDGGHTGSTHSGIRSVMPGCGDNVPFPLFMMHTSVDAYHSAAAQAS
jgi:hypothetical protein